MAENHLSDAESSDPLKKPWYVYLLQCADGTFYTGISTDVARRLQQHNAGRGARYTRGRGPVELLATIECCDRPDALRREHRFKKMMPGARLKAFGLLDAFK